MVSDTLTKNSSVILNRGGPRSDATTAADILMLLACAQNENKQRRENHLFHYCVFSNFLAKQFSNVSSRCLVREIKFILWTELPQLIEISKVLEYLQLIANTRGKLDATFKEFFAHLVCISKKKTCGTHHKLPSVSLCSRYNGHLFRIFSQKIWKEIYYFRIRFNICPTLKKSTLHVLVNINDLKNLMLNQV